MDGLVSLAEEVSGQKIIQNGNKKVAVLVKDISIIKEKPPTLCWYNKELFPWRKHTKANA